MSTTAIKQVPDSGRLGLARQARVIRRYAPYYKRHWVKLFLVFLITPLVGAVFNALLPVLSILLIDEVLPRGDYLWVVLFVTATAFGAVLRDVNFLLESFIRFNLKMEVLRDLGRDFYTHMLKMSMAFHTEHPVGERIFRTFIDTHDAARMLGVSLPTAAAMVLQGLAVTGITLFIDWRPAVAIALFFPPYVALTLYLTRLWRRFDRAMREGRAGVTAHLQETYANVMVVKAATREDDEAKRYRTRLRPFLRSFYGWFVCEGFQEGLVHPAGLAVIFSALMGFMLGYLHIQGQITLGQWVALQGLIAGGLIPLATVILHYQTLCREMVAAERVLEVLQRESQTPDPAAGHRPERLQGSIAFDRVSFAYGDEPPLLKDLSFTIKAGEHVAFVGNSGCGKSTLLHLLLRFYDPQSGAIRIDGIDLREYDRYRYRRRLGVVLQRPRLFPGTVRENLVHGAAHHTPEMVERALALADCTDFVHQLPQGLDTVMDEGGNLSGGQKQRLTLARALARDFDILLLDEPLASVDVDSELRIYEAVRRASGARPWSTLPTPLTPFATWIAYSSLMPAASRRAEATTT